MGALTGRKSVLAGQCDHLRTILPIAEIRLSLRHEQELSQR